MPPKPPFAFSNFPLNPLTYIFELYMELAKAM